jgi:transposase
VSFDEIQDIEVLRQMAKMQQQESARLKKQLTEAHAQLQEKNAAEAEQLALRLQKIENQHAAALKQLFGSKSERGPLSRSTKKPKNKQTGHGRKSQERLFSQDVIHHLKLEGIRCKACNAQPEVWEGQFEDSEEIDFVEPQLILKRHRRTKYRCTCGSCILTAPGPKKLFPKARYSISFAINVVLQKYVYHMPLARQARALGNSGLEVTTATLCDYVDALAALLKPAIDRLPEHILAHSVIGADETTWRVLDTKKKKGQSEKWWVWARQCENAVHYTIDPSRSGAVAKELLGDFQGTVVCDGYSAYESLAKACPKIKLAHCWAHARRELLPYEKDFRAARTLRVIQRMYYLEKIAKERSYSEQKLTAWRRRKIKPLLQAFFRWLATLEIPPTNELRKALLYIQKREKSLMRFLDHPKIKPDNNATERALRGIVLGRKNHYGSRRERGTQIAALFYSLIESAELAGVNPHEYMQAAVEAALDGNDPPLPHEI